MIKDLLDTEGPVLGFLEKTGALIALSVLWLLGCVPIVTIGTSTAAFYYAVIKSVRRGQGSAIKEFWSSYKRNLLRGAGTTAASLALAALLLLNLRILEGKPGPVRWFSLAGLGVLAAVWVYLGPVLSRFDLKITKCCCLAFLMAVRFLHYTAAILAGAWLLGWLQLYVLPIPTVLILPGAAVYAATFPVEKALRRYMPPKEENENAWYYME